MDNGILLGYRSEPYQSLVPLYMLKFSSISLTDSSRAVQLLLIVFFYFMFVFSMLSSPGDIC